MLLLTNFIYFSYFVFFLIKSFFPTRCEMKVFPDHVSVGDPIFNTSQVYSTTLLHVYQGVVIQLPQQILLEKLELYKMKIQLKIAREKIILKKSNFLIMF